MATKQQWWSLIGAGLSLAYGIFLLIYLHNASKYTKQMTKQDQNFRKAALVITWIQVILSGLASLGALVGILSDNSYGPMVVSSPISMGWY